MNDSLHAQVRPVALLFDLDGTLLDSYASHFAAYETMLARFDIQVARTRLLDVYSPDWFAVYLALGLPREKWAEADQKWLAAAAEREPPLFPGVVPMLEEFADHYPLGLVTSGSGPRVHHDLRRTGITDFFQTIITAADVSRPKPDPQGLLKASGRLGVAAAQALYVGDTRIDNATARAAGMPFVGVASPLLRKNGNLGFNLLPGVLDLPAYLENWCSSQATG